MKRAIKYISGFFEKHLILRYLLVGGSAGAADLLALYYFNTVLGIYYLTAALLAFVVAFFISFIFHKFWTFKGHARKTHSQAVMYLGNSVISVILNTLLMYLLVDWVHVSVIPAQMIAGLLVACVTFTISRDIIFKKES